MTPLEAYLSLDTLYIFGKTGAKRVFIEIKLSDLQIELIKELNQVSGETQILPRKAVRTQQEN